MTKALVDAHYAAKFEAAKASKEVYDKTGDAFYCGFAWVSVKLDGRNRKTAAALVKMGFRKSVYPKRYDLWNPGGLNVQNVDIKEVGAKAYAAKFGELTGLDVYADSRLD